MALVTKEIVDSNLIYTISTLYAPLSINSLFSFIGFGENFRYSENGGITWSSWDVLSAENIRAINIESNNENVVVQFSISIETASLLINDGGDKLDINTGGDNLNIA
jgi:hypothetical protein